MKKYCILLMTCLLTVFFAAGCQAASDNAAEQAYVSLEEASGESIEEQPLPPETSAADAGTINITDTSAIEVRFHYPEGLEPVPVSSEDGAKIAELLNGHELIGEWPALDPEPKNMLSLYLDGIEHTVETSESAVIMNDEGSGILDEGVIGPLMEILDNYR